MEEKIKACICIVSSRKRCIKLCLESLWKNFNFKYDYSVYVHYFDDIYDDLSLRDDIRSTCPQNVIFKSVPYKTPSFLKEEELFYNRKNLQYARSFGIRRKGYLHMCHLTSNMYGYENTHLHEYDYIMTHDDESGYDKELPYNPFEIMSKRDDMMGAFKVGQRLRNGSPHQGHLDTRVDLWSLTRKFLKENHITPKNEKLRELLNDENSEWNFHFLDWCDTYVIKSEMFESELWKKWINCINASGGIYKYRWGDNEVISLFANIIQEEIYNFNAVDEGYHNQGKFRSIQDIAPGVKDARK